MKLSMIFGQLESAELNNLSCVDQTTKKMKQDKYPDVLRVISTGLTDLHTRFLLKLGVVEFPVIKEQEVYRLNVLDTKTKSDLLRIHQVFDNHGRELNMNDHTDRFSVFTTDNFTIHVPKHVREKEDVTSLRVVYRKNHKQVHLCDDFDDVDCIDIDLDYAYLWALCLFVASRLHGPVGLQDSTHSINSYVSLYNAECNRLDEVNLDLDYVATNTNARRAGWP